MNKLYTIPFKIICVSIVFQLLAMSCCEQGSSNAQKTNEYYNSILKTNDIAKLNFFFARMPKGGDLHHHYSGAHYVETYLDWAKAKNLNINPTTLKVESSKKNPSITVDSLRANAVLYRSLLSLWSDLDFYNHISLQVPPDQQFFNTFGYFSGLCPGNYPEGFQVLKKRALTENVQYIETMLSGIKIPAKLSGFDSLLLKCQGAKSEKELDQVFTKMLQSIVEDSVKAAISFYTSTLDKAKKGIDDKNFCMRYQTYASRNSSPSSVFVSVYGAFRLCAANKYVVGINLVSGENGIVSMRDYWLHMQIFRYFRSRKEFANLPIALHAGELVMGMVRPEDLSYHINDAVTIAGASRIGHGIDIPYEKNAIGLLKYMANNKKAVEINLTSNEFILGVKGNQHPVRLYYDAGVPIVISTDDAGVSRNNLTQEYMLLASRYGFSYEQIKSFVFNSITYSFMPAKLKETNLELLKTNFNTFEKSIVEFQAAPVKTK